MSRGIRKTGIFIAVMLTVVVLTGCQIAKKDESGQAKEELYGAYAVVGGGGGGTGYQTVR